MNELIEKLKKNEKPFGLLSEEEQECLEIVGKNNCLFYDSYGKWLCGEVSNYFRKNSSYRIRPSYQPEPEYVDYEITLNADTWLGCFVPGKINSWVRLYKVSSVLNFEGFYSKHGRHQVDSISQRINEGFDIYARFRK